MRKRFVHFYTNFWWEGDLYILYQLLVRKRFVHFYTSFWWERDSYIFIPASVEKEICTFLYQLLVRKGFVHFLYQLLVRKKCGFLKRTARKIGRRVYQVHTRIYTSFWWESDCTFLYQLLVRKRLYIFTPASGEKEIVHFYTSFWWEWDCTFLYQLLVRKRFVHFLYQLLVRKRFVHFDTNFWWERDLYIFIPASCERECWRGSELSQLDQHHKATVRRTLLVGQRDRPIPQPIRHVYFIQQPRWGGGVVLIYFTLICAGAEQGENRSESREWAKREGERGERWVREKWEREAREREKRKGEEKGRRERDMIERYEREIWERDKREREERERIERENRGWDGRQKR